jgi:hypothetical protein
MEMRGRSMRIKLTVLVGFAAAVAVVAVQAAAGAGATVVRGDQLLAGASNCPGGIDGSKYTMAGDLVGCWYTDTGEVRNATPSGVVIVSGTEHFVGCLNTNGNQTCDPGEPSGTFSTAYTYTGKYAASGDEIHGRCHHPIIEGSGTGGFAGASGVISFTDIPSEGRFPYHGTISL